MNLATLNVFVSIVMVSLSSTILAKAGPGSCPPEAVSNPSGLYADIYDCTKFYQCSNGVPFHRDCRPGTHFNAQRFVCDWPASAQCIPVTLPYTQRTTPTPTKNDNFEDGSTTTPTATTPTATTTTPTATTTTPTATTTTPPSCPPTTNIPPQPGQRPAQKPNFVILVIDDLGYNDIGWHNPNITTPFMSRLAEDGVILENYYVSPVCTASRGSLLFGRHPIRMGLNHEVIHSGQRNGVPLTFPSLADNLRVQGYYNYFIGKWHIGSYKNDYLPTSRGFDEFLGLVHGLSDHCTHRGSEPFRDFNGNPVTYEGLDFMRGVEPTFNYTNIYSTDVFREEFKAMLNRHLAINPGSPPPFFFDVSFLANHAPLQVPDDCITPSNLTDPAAKRQKLERMVTYVDLAVRQIVEELQAKGVWNNTVLIITTDNGGDDAEGGNNAPLRGGKFTLWEGGVRGVGLVVSGNGVGLIPASRKGTTSTALISITDWYPTLTWLGGGSVEETADGLNIWPAIRDGVESGRAELLHNIDPLVIRSEGNASGYPFDVTVMAAYRLGDWKIITGDPGDGNWYLPDRIIGEEDKDTPETLVRLYNIKADPEEMYDNSTVNSFLVNCMLTRMTDFMVDAQKVFYPDMDEWANPRYYNNVFRPWANEELPIAHPPTH